MVDMRDDREVADTFDWGVGHGPALWTGRRSASRICRTDRASVSPCHPLPEAARPGQAREQCLGASTQPADPLPIPASRRSRNASVAASSSLRVAQPVQQRRGVGRGEDRALGVPTEIRRAVAGGMPDRIDRARGAGRGSAGVPRQAPAPPPRGAPPPCTAGSAPAAARSPPAPAPAACASGSGRRRLLHAPVGPVAERLDHVGRAAGEQQLGLLRRHADRREAGAQRALGPAVERHVAAASLQIAASRSGLRSGGVDHWSRAAAAGSVPR